MGIKSVLAAVAFLTLTVSVIGIFVGLVEFYASPVGSIDKVVSFRFLQYFSITSIIFFGVTLLLRKYTVESILEAFFVVVIAWLFIPFVSALAYNYAIGMDFIDAFFESLSGFSGTGLTMISTPEDFPKTILLWRAITQWVGELGVVVFAGTLLPALHRVIRSVYVVERGERIAPTILSTMRILVGIYAFYTALGTIMFMMGGMSFFDAVTHSMTAIATGGMSTNSLSIGYWFKGSNWVIYTTTTIIMILGAFNFVDHVNLLKGRFKEFITSIEIKWFFIFLALFTAPLVAVSLIQGDGYAAAIRFYHLVSGYTTTGFQLGSSNILKAEPEYVKVIITLSMIVGGATFSTAGGIKIKRAAILMKSLVWESARLFAPPAMVLRRRAGRELLEEKDLLAIYNFISLYLLTFVLVSLTIHISLLLNNYTEFSFVDAMFETASALSCVGLSVGITSSSAPLAIKITLIAAMYLGRLEFAALYLAIGYSYIKKVML